MDKVCGLDFLGSIVGLIVVGVCLVLLGAAICIADTKIGISVAAVGMSLLVGSALIAIATAMTKPEKLVAPIFDKWWSDPAY